MVRRLQLRPRQAPTGRRKPMTDDHVDLESVFTPEQRAQIQKSRKKKLNGDGADQGDAPAYSDEALALSFAAHYARDLRYVAKWTSWLSWAETHWRPDDILHAFDLARRIAREAAATCKHVKERKMIASAKTVAAVERLAKADERLA